MTTQDRRHHAGKPVSLKRLLIATAALPAASLALMLGFAPDADAAPIGYTLNGTITNVPGEISVSGSFDYDPVTGDESHVSILFSGTGTFSGATGTYTQGAATVPSVVVVFSVPTIEAGIGGLSTGTNVIGFSFTSPLGLSPDAVNGIQWCATPSSGCDSGAFTTGGTLTPGVTADAVVPEPSSLALLGSALAFFLRKRRTSRRHGALPAAPPT